MAGLVGDVDNPQFAVPFNMGAEVDQDSDQMLYQGALTVVRYEKGERSALPDFGISDPALRERGADTRALVADIHRWEPDVDVEAVARAIESGVQVVEVDITTNTES